ncbi:MAG: LPS-assembly protein LptD [Acidobacteria bacterium]|nr:LPS-assembly protein LptD [Acidobacteriota bacterium]
MAPAKVLKPIRPNAPGPHEVRVVAVFKEADGAVYHLRGNAEVETTDMLLQADEIDYDSDSGKAQARGHVRFNHYANGEKMTASRADYNIDEQTGTFWDVAGSSPAKIDARPGMLTTSSPFYFEGEWAERQKDKYILYKGYVTDCKVPNPWWILKGPKFDIIPHQRALAYKTIFWLNLPSGRRFGLPGTLRVPLLYAPAFYKSLAKNPRRSGFLTPNIGNSSRRGKMIGVGYYWAINRSYDLLYRAQWFTLRGLAHHVDFRGKVNEKTEFGLTLYGVNDKGIEVGDKLVKQGGFLVSGGGRSVLGRGWVAAGEFNYLSSFVFRQSFTESFHEAIFAESRSTGFVTKHWSSFGVNVVFDRDEVFQFANPGETTPDSTAKVITRKLPEFEFVGRERQILSRWFPLWVSFDSSAGLYRREEPLFSSSQFMDRLDVEPRVTTAFSFKGFSLVPSFSAKATHYGESFTDNRAVGSNIVKTSRELTADLVFPSISRIYDAPTWLGGGKLKHVVETRATYRDVSGVTDFNKIIRIDPTDLVANTREIDISLTNRLYQKTKDGAVNEVLTWQLWQAIYLDPTFGGAILPGQRNTTLSALEITGFAFMDQYRHYSPVVSSFKYWNKLGMEWRADYDPLRHRVVNSSFTADYRKDKYFVSVGHAMVRDDPVLAPSQNQFRASLGVGNDNRRGWNAGTSFYYDYRQQVLQYMSTQVTYNTDCCGFSVQYRRFSLPSRNENQFRIAFSVANLGSFGTLKRQEKLF